MRLNRSDRLVLLFFMAVVLAMWVGVLLDRWFLQPRSSMVRLDEAGMDSLEAEWGGADSAALSGHGSPMSNGSSSSEYYAVPVQQPETFPFDPNTADSTTLLRLGLAPWQVRAIYKYRARGGRYHRTEDFQRLPGMTPELWNRLASSIRIGEAYRYYDREGDSHFDSVSALMKSLRGSDPDAALHYLARLLEAGDLPGACRRILCSASEDIGLAYPQAVSIVKACVDSALQLGLPEARLPLAQAVILLATAPKSNSVVMAIDAATADVKKGKAGPIPRELQNVHADGAGFEREQGYLYPHDYPGHWVRQQYLPDELVGTVYYRPGDNKFEQSCKTYWDRIKGE